MANCYHDKQDFKSDLNIEVAREGDILEAGQDLDEIECNKNPGHRGFIPFKDLTLEHLPIEDRTREILHAIKTYGSRVVRLVVKKIENGKEINEGGSGYVFVFNNTYFVQTNNHVVKTDDDVKRCIVQFHYDSKDSKVLTSYGVKLAYTCPNKDMTMFTFSPVPKFLYQPRVMENMNLPSIVFEFKDNQMATTRVNLYKYNTIPLKFFTDFDLNSSHIKHMFIISQGGSDGYIKSSYFKFQPIPSNIQQSTSIEIHIDEDGGNRRVMPGDVVKFGDEFIVKLSESIFQDEVKKCRLVQNGEVIGRGTRLYFKQFKLDELYNGVFDQMSAEYHVDKHWLFECYPVPRDFEDMLHTVKSRMMCCIGHPHAGYKMVTFGIFIELTEERFDKELTYAKYSCKTCPGSSGSPVFELFKGMNWLQTSCHFMGKRLEGVLSNGARIENLNTCWYQRAT